MIIAFPMFLLPTPIKDWDYYEKIAKIGFLIFITGFLTFMYFLKSRGARIPRDERPIVILLATLIIIVTLSIIGFIIWLAG